MPAKFEDVNTWFLEEYVGIPQIERKPKTSQNIPVSMIKSGDSFLIRRADGIDPMIAWAMGAQNGI